MSEMKIFDSTYQQNSREATNEFYECFIDKCYSVIENKNNILTVASSSAPSLKFDLHMKSVL